MPRLTTETPHRLDDWHVGFIEAIVLDTLAACQPQGGVSSGLRQKRPDDRRFPNPHFPAHKDYLTLTLAHVLKPGM